MQRRQRFEQYQDYIARLFPEFKSDEKDNMRSLSRTVTFQVTDKCNLACTYCYQINKGIRRMSFEIARKLIDLLFTGEKKMDTYISPEFSPALVLEFIGGEPFLEIELIDRICDYFLDKAIELQHPWATKHIFSICSNGVNYFDPKVQSFLGKHKYDLSFSITIDGNKELHDSCRVFPDGRPSYDLAVAGAKDYINKGGYMGSKITIAPENVGYLFEAVKHMITLGYYHINANVVYEKGWETKHNKLFYDQLIMIADYMNENDLVNDIFISLFENFMFKPMSDEENDNWCGGTGLMLACDPDGYLYPCIRYMESSLGTEVKPIRIGNVRNGIASTPEEVQTIKCLDCITRRSQSTDECYNCPIASGCAWCSAYNYQVNGTPDSRVTYICGLHKARVLANAYYWSKYYNKRGQGETFKYYVPDKFALEVVNKKELEKIKNLPNIEIMEVQR